MGVTPAQTAAALRAALAADARATAERERDARRVAHRMAGELLRAGAKEVWLHGSLVCGGFHAHSDIDLAVSGLAPTALDAIRARAAELSPGIGVDIILLDHVETSWADRIRSSGERLS